MTTRIYWLKVGLLFGLAAGLVYLFGVEGNSDEIAINGHSAIKRMVSLWMWSKTDMSHGWLIPLVSAYMIWTRRRELNAASRKASWLGAVVVLLSCLLYLIGLRVQLTVIVLLSGIGLLWGIPMFLYGWPVGRILLFPVGYLIFAVPMTFLDYLTFPLRLVSSTVSVGLLNGLGIPVDQSGTAIMVKVGSGLALDVAHPCSGLRYLLAMIALTTAYAYFTQTSAIKRGILSLSAIPLAMAGNIARITLIALVGLGFGMEFALGFYHDYSGYVVFAVATLLMLGVGRLLDWPRDRKKDKMPETTGTAEDNGKCGVWMEFSPSKALVVIVLFMATGFLGARVRDVSLASIQTADITRDLPDQIGEWQGQKIFFCQDDQCAQGFIAGELGGATNCLSCGGGLDVVALGERTLLPADTIISRKLYQNGRGESVTVTVVLSGHERRSIHRPQQCLPAQGFSIESSSVMSAPIEGRAPLKMTLIKARKGGVADAAYAPRTVMAYWFAGGGHETHDHIRRVAYMAWDNIVHGVRGRWAYVSLQTASGIDDQAAVSRLSELVARLYPVLTSGERSR